MLTDEQAADIKVQIFKQIDSWPEEQREGAKKKIEEMNNEELEQFLIRNKLIPGEGGDDGGEAGEAAGGGGSGCIFCSLAEKKIPGSIVSEGKEGIALLEINPVSAGHVIVIPKKHVLTYEEAGKEFSAMADFAAGVVKSAMKVKTVDRWVHSPMGHAVVNLIPIYDETKIDFGRKKATPDELKALMPAFADALKKKEEEKKEKEKLATESPTKETKVLYQAPSRTP